MYLLVGIGGVAAFFGFAALATRINKKAELASKPINVLLHSLRFLFVLLCVAPLCLAWFYMLIYMRSGISELASLAVGVMITIYVAVKAKIVTALKW